MTQQIASDAETGESQHRGRRRAKAFPVLKFEETLSLPKTILDEGVGGSIQRLTLFEKLNRSPGSGRSRDWVRNSERYGLTHGGTSASSLSVTDAARAVLSSDDPNKAMATKFRLAIEQFEAFNSVYLKLNGEKLPSPDVLGDELGKQGISGSDYQTAVEVFTANLRYLGLLQNIGESEYVRDVADLIKQSPPNASGDTATDNNGLTATAPPVASAINGAGFSAGNSPALHVDVQIHIDASASPDQIDQIFVSMARYLYGREV